MWKKTIALIAAVMLFAALLPATMAANTADITINISTAGELAVATKSLTVSDQDSDGKLTINDAIIAAHNAYYDGGAAAGFVTEKTQYGLSIIKFWGIENGGSYGYYLNNALADGLTSTIKSGDVLTAYAFADLTDWSDVYTFFNVTNVTAQAGKAFTLTLNKVSFDDNWQAVTEPLANATIVVNNGKVNVKTNKQGKVTLTLDQPGTYVISAVSSDETIVPPACNVRVTTELEFVDVAKGAWYYDAVMFCAKNGLLKGRSTELNIFAPDDNMTIAEYLTILYRLDKNIGLYGDYETTGSNWQAAAKHVAEKLGFKFANFDKPITRGEMAAVTAAHMKAFAEYKGYKIIEKEAITFNDTKNSPYKDDISFIQKVGIAQGYGDGTFKPNNNIRRSEVGQIIYNYLDVQMIAE